MRATARNSQTGEIIDIDIDVLILHLNEKSVVELHYDEAALLITIIDRSPKIATYDEIQSSVFPGNQGDLETLLRKRAHSVRKKINPHIADLFTTIRAKGYRLSDPWNKIAVGQDELGGNIDKLLDAIAETLARCIKLMSELEFMKRVGDSGEEILSLESKIRAVEIENISRQFDAAALALIHTVSEKSPLAEGPIGRILGTIRSYVTMSRSGSGISQGRWRELYQSELIHHFNMLKKLSQNFPT